MNTKFDNRIPGVTIVLVRRVGVALATTLAVLTAATMLPASPAAEAATKRLQTRSMRAVNTAYWAQWNPGLGTTPGWTGQTGDCASGAMSATARARMAASVNFARRLNGLAPVGYRNGAANAAAQAAARLMDANGALSHSPARNWRCWTPLGANAASTSNIGLHYGSPSVTDFVQDYFDEPGTENLAVGHRRWLLYPEAKTFGFGATNHASAIKVLGVAKSSHRPNPAWVSWPSAGYFPSTMEPAGRWSLSAGSTKVSFARARVVVTHNGVRWPLTRYSPHSGYGRPTLVWQLPDNMVAAGAFKVTVTKIRHRGSKKNYTHTYTVNFFTPYH